MYPPVAALYLEYSVVRMSDPHAAATLRRFGGGLLVLGVSLGFVFFVLLCAGGAAALVPGRTARPIVFVVIFGGAVLSLVPLSLGYAIHRSRVLDAELRRFGLRPSGWIPNLREYHGEVGGRAVDVLFARRGPLLSISVGAELYTELAVGTQTTLGRALGGLVSVPEVPGLDPSFAPFVVRATEPEWAGPVLNRPAVRDAVIGLAADPTGRELRTLAIRPGALQLTRNYFRVPPAGVTSEVERMLALASSLEGLPAPTRQVVPSALERQTRANPTRIGVMIALMLVGGLVLVSATFLVAAFAIGLANR